MILRKSYSAALLLAFCALSASAQESERLFDVRKLIRETLDVIRAYPAPSSLTQPVLNSLDQSTGGKTTQPSASTSAQITPFSSNNLPLDPNAAQTQQLYLLPQQYLQQQQLAQHQPQLYQQLPQAQAQTYRRIVGDSTASAYYQQQVQQQLLQQQQELRQPTYGMDTVRVYGSQTMSAPQAIVASGAAQNYAPTITASSPDTVAPAGGASLVLPTPPPVARLFATPTRQDIERLLHLPADIVHRMAADAGYVDAAAPQERDRYSYVSSDGADNADAYGGYYQLSQQQQRKNDGGGFNFNIQDSNANTAFTQQVPSTTTQMPKKTIIASGTPKVLIRSANRDGKLIQLPVLAVPQSNGHSIYLPYERLADLSTALTKLVSSGKLLLDANAPIFHSPEALIAATADQRAIAPKSAVTDAAVSASASQNGILGATSVPITAASRNPLFDQSSDAIATNRLPAQTFRKLFPVTDRVYPNTVVVSDADRLIAAAGTGKTAAVNVAAANTAFEQQLMPMSAPTAPPTKKLADKRDRKRVMATETNAFLQEIDDETRDATDVPVASSSESSADAAAPQKNENSDGNVIILNGKRYKLVATDAVTVTDAAAVATHDENKESSGEAAVGAFTVQNYNNDTVFESKTAAAQNRAQLKSAPTEVPARPLPLAGLDSSHSNEAIHVTQQKDVPSLSQPKELFSSSPVQAKYGELLGSLMKHNNVGQQQQIQQQKQQQPQIQQQDHPDLPNQQQLELQRQQQPISQPQQLVQSPEFLQRDIHQQNKNPQQPQINDNTQQRNTRPVQILTAAPSERQQQKQSHGSMSSGARVAQGAEREHFVVSSGAMQKPLRASDELIVASKAPLASAPLRAAISRAAASAEVRRKEPNKSRENMASRERVTTAFLPYQRQYSLKELEQHYRRQHAAAQLTSAASDETERTTSAARVAAANAPSIVAEASTAAGAGRLKINSLRSTERISTPTGGSSSEERRSKAQLSESALRKLTRLEALRRQFANDRLALTRRLKSVNRNADSASSKSEELVAPQSNPPAYCHRIRSLARQYGQLDVAYFARANCGIVAQIDAQNLQCGAVDEYLTKCEFRKHAMQI